MGKKSPFSRFKEAKLRKFASTCSLNENNIVILGDGQVGKSSIIRRFVDDRFPENYVPTISDVFQKRAVLKDLHNVPTSYPLRLFDTAGSIAFPAMNRVTISQGCAFVIVYSVDSESSIETAARLLREIAEIKDKKVPCVLVGNKSDTNVENRKVSFERALQLAVQWRAAFFEVSAKQDSNISDIFEVLVRKLEAMELCETQTGSLHRKFSSISSDSPVLYERRRRYVEPPCKVM